MTTRRAVWTRAFAHGGARALAVLALGCAQDSGGTRNDEPSGATAIDPSLPACGGPAEACCAPPRFSCARGLRCNPGTGLCEAGDAAAATPSLCRSEADCVPPQRCCIAGDQGTCQPLAPGAACALPDLALLDSGAGVTLETEVFNGTAPSEGGCVRASGVRRRLRAAIAVANFGAADFILGERRATARDSAEAIDAFIDYSLFDSAGARVASSRGPLPCARQADPAQRFSCDFLGLESGAVAPAHGIECEAIDVTELPAGQYRLVAELAVTGRWPDANADNERVELRVDLPSFNPLEPCPRVVSPLAGSGMERECGWTRLRLADEGRCSPGAPLQVDCGSCVGFPLLRMCAGDTTCSGRTAVDTNGAWFVEPNGAPADPCTALQSVCPPDGRYNVLISSEDGSPTVSCRLAPGMPFYY